MLAGRCCSGPGLVSSCGGAWFCLCCLQCGLLVSATVSACWLHRSLPASISAAAPQPAPSAVLHSGACGRRFSTHTSIPLQIKDIFAKECANSQCFKVVAASGKAAAGKTTPAPAEQPAEGAAADAKAGGKPAEQAAAAGGLRNVDHREFLNLSHNWQKASHAGRTGCHEDGAALPVLPR